MKQLQRQKSRSRWISPIFMLMLVLNVFALGNMNASKKTPQPFGVIKSNTNPLPSTNPTTLNWSGYNWSVKNSQGDLWGPGPNKWNSSVNNVWVDPEGFLHLKITNTSGVWECAEIYSQQSFGHGIYTFKLQAGFENLDKNVILGLFTYLNDENEIDIEFARWGQETTENSQYVTQPYSIEGNMERFATPFTGKDSVHTFTWCESFINFWSQTGNSSTYETDSITHNWEYTGKNIPTPSSEHVHLNLWLMSGLAPNNSQEQEVVIKDFSFTPTVCGDPSLPLWVYGIIIGFVGVISLITLLRIKAKKK
jgi:hypothetical protein